MFLTMIYSSVINKINPKLSSLLGESILYATIEGGKILINPN